LPPSTSAWQDRFTGLFEAHYDRLFRYLDRLSDDPELAADLAQEAFLALYRRGDPPDQPGAWLISVAMNRLRNVRSTERRRRRLLTLARSEASLADPPPSPEAGVLGEGERARVRRALDALPARERQLLLLHAEGYSYREIASALAMNFASIGTTLVRARRAFQERYGDRTDPS
jgi:RNA polymerase sigma-70 factor (ECF subfamily)